MRTLAALLCVACLAPVPLAAQTLDRASAAVRSGGGGSRSSASSPPRTRGGGGGSFAAGGSAPRQRSGSRSSGSSGGLGLGWALDAPPPGRLPRHDTPGTGPAWIPPPAAPAAPDPDQGSGMSARDPGTRVFLAAGFDAAYVIPSMVRGTVSGRLVLPATLELLVQYAGYLEPRPHGLDAIAIGRLAFGTRFRAQSVDVRVLFGGRHFQDWFAAQLGLDAMIAMDLAPVDPLVVSAELAIGFVGSAWIAQARATIGARIDDVELHLGYDHVAIDAWNGEGGVQLGGPLLGVRVWAGL
jgi:hypothetical protein